ncbi:MAG: TPM domain-containing protein [Rhodocyclaceae bacterium]
MLRLLSALLLTLWAALAGAEALQQVPALQARVTDLTATLTPAQHSQLEARLAAFEAEKGSQIAVLIVPTVKPEAIEQYAMRVVEQWKLGRKDVDDGVLLLIAKQDKKLRIEVGYGLEGALNDATARRIIAETITPRFKEGKFYEGIDAGIGRIITVVVGEPLPEPASAMPDSPELLSGFGVEELLIVGLAIVTGGTWLLRKVFGRFFGAAFAGGIAGSIALFFVSSMFVAGIVGFIVFIFSLLSGGRSSPWGSGGFGGGLGGGYGGSSSTDSGWSSSSSDSFSGGGGDFGGGGASGDW